MLLAHTHAKQFILGTPSPDTLPANKTLALSETYTVCAHTHVHINKTTNARDNGSNAHTYTHTGLCNAYTPTGLRVRCGLTKQNIWNKYIHSSKPDDNSIEFYTTKEIQLQRTGQNRVLKHHSIFFYTK